MFGRKKKKNIAESPLEAVERTISKIKIERQKNIIQIDLIKKWAVELIFDVFEVPKKYWYQELEKYEEIKQLEENKNISKPVIEKTDEIFKVYTGKIEILEKENTFLQNTLEKLEAIKESLIKQEKAAGSTEEKLTDKLQKHQERAERLGANLLENDYKYAYNVQMLETSLDNLKKDLEAFRKAQEAVVKFFPDIQTTDFSVINDELDKLIQNIKKGEK